ncbi:MAG TPA: Fic family protein [Gemmatimonadaceae bacterium]|nr:Fic family protein [Gemmatimonadaceae bacterium]
MKRSLRAGRVEIQQGGKEGYGAFIPARLPPSPAVTLNGELQTLLERASRALGRLDGISLLLPDPRLFLHMYVRKEAVLSSQIEGTQSSLSDLLLFENNEIPDVGIDDVREVSNYTAAMEYGLERLRNGFPLSLRLIREIHGILMENARGGDKTPGEFRRSQNWIGGSRPGDARFVPPPPHELKASLDNLEKFLHAQNSVPLLVKAGLAHAQFETIHPFLDGNGRIGRLLITFLLCAEGALTQPLLYLSLYLKEHRDEYYESLQRMRTEGDWEGWLKFYLRGVESVALQATSTARNIVQLLEADRQRIQGIGKGASSALRVHELLKERPILSIASTVGALKMTKPTAASAMENLQALNIVREESGRRRDRYYVYRRYINVLNEGTE